MFTFILQKNDQKLTTSQKDYKNLKKNIGGFHPIFL